MAVYIYGKFKDIAEQDVFVDIWSSGYDANSTFEIEDSSNADIYFSDDPVHITAESNDVTDEVIKHGCSISFVSKIWLGDYLFAKNPTDIKVLVYTSNAILFAGFATPVSFSQDYSQHYNKFTLECVDLLGNLSYYYYLNNNYELAVLNASIPTFRTAISRMHLSQTFTSPRKTVSTNLIYVTSHNTNFSNKLNLRYNDLVFLGESEKDVKMEDETLASLLRYFGWRIIQQGATIMIYDPSEILRSHGTKPTYNLSDNTSFDAYNFNNTAEISKFPKSVYDISMSDVYTQMKINCKTQAVKDTIGLFDSNDLINNQYSGRQLYVTEFSGDNFNEYKNIVRAGSIDGSNSDKVWTRDWYFRFLSNRNWIFNDANGNNIANLNYADQRQYMEYIKTNAGAALLCELKNTGKVTGKSKNTITNKLQGKNYVYISVNGNGSDDINTRYPTYDDVSNPNGLIVYNNIQNFNFAPTDSYTTNYLVFTGKIKLLPLAYTDGYVIPTGQNTTKYTFVTDFLNSDFKTIQDHIDGQWTFHSGGYGSQNNAAYSSQTVIMPNIAACGAIGHNYIQRDERDNTKVTMTPPRDKEESPTSLNYNYSCQGSDQDTISKLSILVCSLQIGNKYLLETIPTDGSKSTYSWVTDSTATFTLGIDPEIGTPIIGHDYELANNISADMNLDISGMAVPIPYGTELAGELHFKILSLVDGEWDEVSKKTKRFLGFKVGTKWKTTSHFILSHVQALVMEDFSIKLTSNYAGLESLEDKDLVYLSDENPYYVRNIHSIDFDIYTGLTNQEAYNLGMKNVLNMNMVYNNDNSVCTTITSSKDNQAKKAEVDYIDRYYDFFANPQKIVKYTMRIPDNITNIGQLIRFAKCNNVAGQYCMNKEIDYDCKQRILEASGYQLSQ